jgi:hypothetical protein
VSETTHPVRPEQDSGITDDDRRTASRFVLGRPGWRLETRATAQSGTYLHVTTPCSRTGGQRSWRVVRTRQGLVIQDGASERQLGSMPTIRDALVEIWEAATGAVPD